MTRPQLPAALASWASALSVLEPRLAIALGPMVRQLDELVHRGDATTAGHGALDGYGGLSGRGEPSRVLASEWVLATELPWEFLRRAANAELLHLEPSYLDVAPRGRVAVLVDCGPDQIGAGRLVQLAALVVLQRRAERFGTGLMLGVLGDVVGSWRTGQPRELLSGWLAARTARPPRAQDVEQWCAPLDAGDEAWLLTGPELAAEHRGRRRLIVSCECAWSPHGALAVEVEADGHRVELALPHGEVAARALRGAAIRSVEETRTVSRPLRHLAFTSAAPALLARGHDATEIVHIGFSPSGAGTPPKPQHHRFGAPVLTAAVIGRRIVALVSRGGEITVEVHGKRLGQFADFAVEAEALGLDADDVARIADGELSPLVYDSGNLVVSLDGYWWTLSATDPPSRDENVLAVLARDAIDQPSVARRWGADQIFVTYRRAGGPVQTNAEQIVLGPNGLVAWPEAGNRWHVAPNGRAIVVGEGESVRALQEIDDAPAFVTVSAAGLIVRLRWPAADRTLTAWSGGTEQPVVHPSRPWIAVRNDGRLLVGDLNTGATLLRLTAGS